MPTKCRWLFVWVQQTCGDPVCSLQMLAGYLNLQKFPVVVNCYRDCPICKYTDFDTNTMQAEKKGEDYAGGGDEELEDGEMLNEKF